MGKARTPDGMTEKWAETRFRGCKGTEVGERRLDPDFVISRRGGILGHLIYSSPRNSASCKTQTDATLTSKSYSDVN